MHSFLILPTGLEGLLYFVSDRILDDESSFAMFLNQSYNLNTLACAEKDVLGKHVHPWFRTYRRDRPLRCYDRWPVVLNNLDFL